MYSTVDDTQLLPLISKETIETTPINETTNAGCSTIGHASENSPGTLNLNSSSLRCTKWSPVNEGITVAWNDLSIHVITSNGTRELKRIVNGVSGAVKAGSLVALMGASGAGKSTLMSALAYRNSGDMIVRGDILINGRPIGEYLKHLSGYVHQEDIFVGSLTVWEHMNLMALLKLDRRTTVKERKDKIQRLLRNLSLMKCKDIRIGSMGEGKTLSGGEKKRLAFATELLTDPPLLFCDEPTTGLDSYSAQKMIAMMNMMTSSGKTILCTIHQPSSEIFAMFSQLILLAEGRIAYMGSRYGATEFFHKLGYICPESYNPADFYIKTLATTPGYVDNCKHVIKTICDQFAVSDYAKEVDVVVQYEFHMGRTSHLLGVALGYIIPSNLYVKPKIIDIVWGWGNLPSLVSMIYRTVIDREKVQAMKAHYMGVF